jgi:hypothetical protein
MALTNNGLNESVCQSYLLRIWRDGEDGEWRAMLLTIPTQERHQFTSIESLFNFLEFRADHPVSRTPVLAAVPGFKVIEEVTDRQT